MEDEWQSIETAPQDGRQVLACFDGQFQWVIFTAYAYPKTHGGVQAPGYAAPEYWKPMPQPPHPHQGQR